ncbi:MAG: hypothetical protein ABI843_06180 [Dokdonella sp.]
MRWTKSRRLIAQVADLSLASHPLPTWVDAAIVASTDAAVTFGGSAEVTLAAGVDLVSDPVSFAVPPLSDDGHAATAAAIDPAWFIEDAADVIFANGFDDAAAH